VQQMSRSKLQEGLRNTGDLGNGSATGFALAPGSSASVGVNRIQFP